jgi:hypothetical protein
MAGILASKVSIRFDGGQGRGSGYRFGKKTTMTGVMSQIFIEEQQQILRLTTPNLHPTNEDLFVGTPERLKSTPGAPFAQDDNQ